MLKWNIRPIELALKYTWKISRGEVSQKTNYVVSVTDTDSGATGIGEASSITGPSGVADNLEQIADLDIQTIDQIYQISDISENLRFAMESALVHLEASATSQSVSDYLGLKKAAPIKTSFSLPILPIGEIGSFMEKQSVSRFSVLKVKVGHSDQVETCQEVARHFDGPLRVDANEAIMSADDALQFIKKVSSHAAIEFLEQPLPRKLEAEYRKLKSSSPVPIVADESVQAHSLSPDIAEQFHGINVKLMKTGSYKVAKDQIQMAKKLGLKTMLGCMVESSLGIWSATNIAGEIDWLDLDGFLFLKEDPFQLVQEKDGVLFPGKRNSLSDFLPADSF